MKKRHVFLINLIFASLILFSVGVVYQFFTGQKPLAVVAGAIHKPQTKQFNTTNCTADKAIDGLAGATTSTLRKLNLFQEACHSRPTDTMMIFTSMPSTPEQGLAYAQEDAKTFKEFAKYHVRPLVVMEPSDRTGELLDFALFADGTYTPAIDTYFATLKQAGITDEQLGIWTPFPEANLPYWKNNETKYFAPAVTAHLQTARKYFPHLTTSVMLNSATYESTDFNWENGDYISLLQYVKGIPAGLVDYAGIQGFPWTSRTPNGPTIFNAAEFLAPKLLTEMADQLGTKNIWFNTATFGRKYTLDAAQTKMITAEQRKQILLTVKEQALSLKKKNYNVSVNIFAQDKSKDAEETDWSYWQDNKPLQSKDSIVLTDFIRSLHDSGVSVWLFDK